MQLNPMANKNHFKEDNSSSLDVDISVKKLHFNIMVNRYILL